MSTGKIIAIVLAIVAAIGVGMVALCGGLLYMGYRSASESATPQIGRLFAAIDKGTFADTYETMTTSEYRHITSQQQHADIGSAIAARLGAIKSKSLTRFNLRQMNANSYIDVDYNATFEKASGTISARLKSEGGQWKFVTFRVQSPEFQKDLATAKCAKCGAPHTADAKFCPACGATIESQ
jgi:hypothetical protein